VPRNPEETRARLVDAAEAEFNAHGFDGTDTNRIARRAGYAPQTFYRHFADKTAVFLAVYDRWWRNESDAIRSDIARPGARAD
jgi:AcrR family transcriptional regulator